MYLSMRLFCFLIFYRLFLCLWFFLPNRVCVVYGVVFTYILIFYETKGKKHWFEVIMLIANTSDRKLLLYLAYANTCKCNLDLNV